MLILPSCFLLLVLLSSAARAGTLHINAVLHNTALQHVPADASEQQRIQAHLTHVSNLLEQRTVIGQAGQRRQRILQVLRQYTAAGQFPQHSKNAPVPGCDAYGDRRPVFRDERGVLCAVGHLMWASADVESAARATVDRVMELEPYGYVLSDLMKHSELRGGLSLWADRFGFTATELAMIQPSYDCQRFCRTASNEPRSLQLFYGVRGPCYPVTGGSALRVACEVLPYAIARGECSIDNSTAVWPAVARSFPYVFAAEPTNLESARNGDARVRIEDLTMYKTKAEVDEIRSMRKTFAFEEYAPQINVTLSEAGVVAFSGRDYEQVFDAADVQVNIAEIFDSQIKQPALFSRAFLYWVDRTGASLILKGGKTLHVRVTRGGNVTMHTLTGQTFDMFPSSDCMKFELVSSFARGHVLRLDESGRAGAVFFAARDALTVVAGAPCLSYGITDCEPYQFPTDIDRSSFAQPEPVSALGAGQIAFLKDGRFEHDRRNVRFDFTNGLVTDTFYIQNEFATFYRLDLDEWGSASWSFPVAPAVDSSFEFPLVVDNNSTNSTDSNDTTTVAATNTASTSFTDDSFSARAFFSVSFAVVAILVVL